MTSFAIGVRAHRLIQKEIRDDPFRGSVPGSDPLAVCEHQGYHEIFLIVEVPDYPAAQ